MKDGQLAAELSMLSLCALGCMQHYIPTVLAAKLPDHESQSYCSLEGIVAADWSAGGGHPKAFA